MYEHCTILFSPFIIASYAPIIFQSIFHLWELSHASILKKFSVATTTMHLPHDTLPGSIIIIVKEGRKTERLRDHINYPFGINRRLFLLLYMYLQLDVSNRCSCAYIIMCPLFHQLRWAFPSIVACVYTKKCHGELDNFLWKTHLVPINN